MKKTLGFLFVFLYVLSVSGATFNLHFCGNSLERISFAGFGKKGCCCGVKMKDSDCCKDKQVSLKSGKDQQRFETAALPVLSPKKVETILPEFQFSAKHLFIANAEWNDHSPPLSGKDSELFILNRVFRI